MLSSPATSRPHARRPQREMKTTMTGTLQIRLLPALAYMLLLAVVAAMLGLGVPAAFAQAGSDAPTIYRLNPGSSFQQGCFTARFRLLARTPIARPGAEPLYFSVLREHGATEDASPRG